MKLINLKYLIVIFTLCFVSSFAQETEKDSIATGVYESVPDQIAKEAVSMIVRYTGLQSNFTVVSKDINTAQAYIKAEKRYIAYNPEFIKRVTNVTQTDWAAVSVLAHEIGHHLAGHTLKKQSNAGDELVADRFSGFILHQMGATLEEARAALTELGDHIDTLNHPPKSARLDAVESGWQEAEFLQNCHAYNDLQCKEPDRDTLDIKFKCTFKGDDHSYLVDSKDRIIWFDNYGSPIIIGMKEASITSNFVWDYVYNNQRYGVDSKGQIWQRTSYGTVFIIGKAEEVAENDSE